MLMLDAKIAEGQLLDQFLEALRELPEVQAELVSTLQPGGPDRGYDAPNKPPSCPHSQGSPIKLS